MYHSLYLSLYLKDREVSYLGLGAKTKIQQQSLQIYTKYISVRFIRVLIVCSVRRGKLPDTVRLLCAC